MQIIYSKILTMRFLVKLQELSVFKSPNMDYVKK
jgi:hypothetical protein